MPECHNNAKQYTFSLGMLHNLEQRTEGHCNTCSTSKASNNWLDALLAFSHNLLGMTAYHQTGCGKSHMMNQCFKQFFFMYWRIIYKKILSCSLHLDRQKKEKKKKRRERKSLKNKTAQLNAHKTHRRTHHIPGPYSIKKIFHFVWQSTH